MRRILAAALALAIFLTGCGQAEPKSPPEREGYGVYRISGDGMESGGGLLGQERYVIPEGEDVLTALTRALTAEPLTDGLRSPFASGTEIISHKLENGELILKMNSDYLKLEGMDKTIADYSIALTLCMVQGVRAVSIYAGGVCYAKGLTAEDAVTEDITSPFEKRIALYFPDEENRYLVREYHTMYESAIDSYESIERYVVEKLMDGPITPRLRRVLPEGIRIRSISTSDGVCTVNLYSGFAESVQEGLMSERLAVYSFVNTLCSLSWISKVRFLEEGNTIDSFAYLPLKSNFSENLNIMGPPQAAKDQFEAFVYLRHLESGKLSRIPVIAQREKDESDEAAVIRALLATPAETGFSNLLTMEDMPLSLQMNGSICHVSLARKFFESRTDEQQIRLAAMAIAATLTELSNVSSVSFDMEGSPVRYGSQSLQGSYTRPSSDILT